MNFRSFETVFSRLTIHNKHGNASGFSILLFPNGEEDNT